MPTVQNDDYSCGFWAVEILLQIVLDKVSLKDGVKVAFEVEEYRKYLSQLVQTRWVGIKGTLRKLQPHLHILAPVSVESASMVGDD
jgi:hypothetical protein